MATKVPPLIPTLKTEITIPIQQQQDSMSFKGFQNQIDETGKAATLARKQNLELLKKEADSLKIGIKLKPIEIISELLIDEEEEELDGNYLENRLLQLTREDLLTLVKLFKLHLENKRGELILSLDQSNLTRLKLSNLFESTLADDFIINHEIIILPKIKIDKILATLIKVGNEIGSTISILVSPFDQEGRYLKSIKEQQITASSNDDLENLRWSGKSLKFLVRKIPESAVDLLECRVAVVGNVDAGKSSLLGVLTGGRLDDGRGRARVNLFRHKHEIESGRTSSVGVELLGFTPAGEQILAETYHPNKSLATADSIAEESKTRRQQLGWEEIASRASRIISFVDLAGHERYLKTTLFGLTASLPDFVLLIVGANQGLIGMCKEHLSVTLALSVPVVVIVTKIDMTPPLVLEATLKQLSKVLRSPGCRKNPIFVKDTGMAIELGQNFVAERACPIFLASNVTGTGLELLTTFLNVVSTSTSKFDPSDPFEFSISDVFSVPFVGAVASGVIVSGRVAIGDNVLLGPDSLGQFISTAIKSIQRKRVPVLSAEAGQSVSFALKKVKRVQVRKGMVLLAKNELDPPKAVKRFEGQVLTLYHNTLIVPKYQAMLHVGAVRQTVRLDAIESKGCLRTGDKANCSFTFIQKPEFIKVGQRMLLREGKTKLLGHVTKLLD